MDTGDLGMHHLSWNSALISWRLPVWGITSFLEWSSDFLGWHLELFLEKGQFYSFWFGPFSDRVLIHFLYGTKKAEIFLSFAKDFLSIFTLSRIALFCIIVRFTFWSLHIFFSFTSFEYLYEYLWNPLWRVYEIARLGLKAPLSGLSGSKVLPSSQSS